MNEQTRAFMSIIAECREQLENIEMALDDHLDVPADAVAWAHVGDAGRLLGDLQQIVKYLEG